MDRAAKNTIRKLVLDLRETLEAEIDRELGRYGIYADRPWIDASDLSRLSERERDRDRPRIEATIRREREAGLGQPEAVRAFIRETAYTHMNRLLGLKCMEARGLIDETITTRPIYSDRSKRHRDYLDEHPEAHHEPEQGLVAMLQQAYVEVSRHIGVVFDPESDYSIVWPRHTVLKECIGQINAVDEGVAGKLGHGPESMTSVFADDTILGWVYQYFQEKEKKRVFDDVYKKKRKISGYDIIPATTAYTERYMVQFLIENSLGALWMEMYPDSDLCDGWEYFVEDPNLQNEDGTRKQGRDRCPVAELTLLDPACGSGHFLLYAFDLFAQMYEAEARMERHALDRAEIGRRILRDNLYGIDIDLRSIQLSALNLYMKACTYARVRLDELQNEGSVQMNLVCTDIVLRRGPELKELLDLFEGDALTQELVNTIWRGLENARERGSLLKVEEQVDEVIARKRKAERDTFWEHPEELWGQWKRDFLNTLKEYVDRAAECFDVNRRMFGQEAIKGVQLIDLLTHRYAAVATNPPYMGDLQMGPTLKQFTKHSYAESSSDMYAVFIERCLQLAAQDSYIAMITQQAFMFNVDLAQLRADIITKNWIRSLAHLGPGAFEDIGGEKVDTAMFTVRTTSPGNKEGVFIRLLEKQTSAEKNSTLRHLVRNHIEEGWFEIQQADFQVINGTPMVYWITPAMLSAFRDHGRVTQLIEPKAGLSTGDNPRFVRYWWELPATQDGTPKWRPCMSGGEYTRWYRSPIFAIDWQNDGERIKNFRGSSGRQRSAVRNETFYFTEGLTFLKNGTVAFSPWYTAGNCVFLDTNRFIHVKRVGVFYALAFLNSAFVDHALNLLNPAGGFSHTNINRIPYKPPQAEENLMSQIAKRSVQVKRELLDSCVEDFEFTKVAFERNGVTAESPTLLALYETWLQQAEDSETELIVNKAAVDRLVFEAYGFDDTSVDWLMRFETTPAGWYPVLEGHANTPCGILPVVQKYVAQLPRMEFSEKKLKTVKSELAQLYAEQGKCIEEVSGALQINPVSVVALRREMHLINPADFMYQVENFLTHHTLELCKRDEDGIIPYDDGLQNPSLLEQVRGEIEHVFGSDRAVAIETEMDEILGRGGLAGWLGNPFFRKHVTQFKKRPILWQITSPDQQFRVLVYYHKLDHDTLPKIRSQYLWPLLERARTHLRAARRQDPPDMKTIGDLEAYIADLEQCDQLLENVIGGSIEVGLPDWANGPYRGGRAPYSPDLDDGVNINILPLQAAGLLPMKKVV